MKDNKDLFLYLFGMIPCIWLAILLAPYIDKGLVELMRVFPIIISNPFKITWISTTPKTIFLFLIIYVFIIGVYTFTRKNYRKTEEYGSAKWGLMFHFSLLLYLPFLLIFQT